MNFRWSLVRALLLAVAGPGLLAGCATKAATRFGATVPWTRYEAEDARCNVPPGAASWTYLTPESEASGRRLVRLEKPGDFVEISVVQPARGLVLRYGLPDSPDGRGLEATLGLYVNGAAQKKLELTSRYTWVYGDFPWTNQPAAGRGHHFFDECQVLIPDVVPGDTVRLQVDEGDAAPYYLIDFLELEPVAPPRSRPAHSVSITEFGGVADDDGDDAEAFLKCLEAAKAQRRVAWIPAGTFILDGDVKGLGGVDVRGAGMWHSRLTGRAPMFYGYGERFTISDLSIFGQVDYRNDYSPDNAFFGKLGDGSKITRVWIERLKCGVWSNYGTRNLRIAECRIRNTMADGVNFCDGTTDSVVEQCHLRNNGDDALATWSPTGDWSSKKPCERNKFLHNTVELPWHANGLAIYGGRDHEARGNLVVDTVQSGGGLLISSGHGAHPFAGTLRVEDHRFIRTGGDCYIDGKNGGLWIHAHESDIDIPVTLRNLEILESAHAAITIHGPRALRHVSLENVLIRGPQERGIHLMPSATNVSFRLDGFLIQRETSAKTTAAAAPR